MYTFKEATKTGDKNEVRFVINKYGVPEIDYGKVLDDLKGAIRKNTCLKLSSKF